MKTPPSMNDLDQPFDLEEGLRLLQHKIDLAKTFISTSKYEGEDDDYSEENENSKTLDDPEFPETKVVTPLPDDQKSLSREQPKKIFSWSMRWPSKMYSKDKKCSKPLEKKVKWGTKKAREAFMDAEKDFHSFKNLDDLKLKAASHIAKGLNVLCF